MRVPGEGDDDVRLLFEHGSSSWSGPNPQARQSRWATHAARRRVAGTTRLIAAGGLAAVLGLTVVAVWASPAGPVATVIHLVAQAFPGVSSSPDTGQGTFISSPAPSGSSSSARTAGPGGPGRATPRPGGRSPVPYRGGTPSPHASPGPSWPPDE